MVGIGREARRWMGCCYLAVLLSGLSLSPVGAVIETLTSLEKFVADADLILVANVKQVNLEQGRLVFTVESRLKGADSPAAVPIKLAGNANEALAEVKPGDAAVLFVSRGPQQNLAYGYVGGAWFHVVGTPDQETVRWQFKAGEPYLRRTYSDQTTQLIELLTANQAGTGGLPVPDATIPPGYGFVVGKHPIPQAAHTAAVATSPASASPNSSTSQLFTRNILLAMIAACCALVLAFMLVRSVPVEDADA